MFAEEADYDRAEQGQGWRIPGLAEAVRSGRPELEAETPAGPVRLELRLSDRERAIILIGGLVAYAKAT